MSVYTPWLRKWIVKVQEIKGVLAASPKPFENPPSTRKEFAKLFSGKIPPAPLSHCLSEVDRRHFASLWPAGEHAARERLQKFCNEKIQDYALHRSAPGLEASSCMSVHLSQGTISARSCIRQAQSSNTSQKLNKGKQGNICWINEVAWRDFYRRLIPFEDYHTYY